MTLKLSLTVQPFSSTVKKNTCSRRVKYDSPTFLSQSWTLTFDRASKQVYFFYEIPFLHLHHIVLNYGVWSIEKLNSAKLPF